MTDQPRKCRACKAPLTRRPKEWTSTFSKRVYCDDKCRHSAHFEKDCPQCGKRMVADGGNAVYELKRRTYCSRTCASLANRVPVEPNRACKVCARPLVQKEGETNSDFAARKCCNRACAIVRASEAQRSRPRTKLQQAWANRAHDMKVAGNQAIQRKWEALRIGQLPRGKFETVEEFVARGGSITRVETPVDVPLGGIPVRGKPLVRRG